MTTAKYEDGSLSTRPFRRNYVRNSSNMTTYSLDGFWKAVGDVGLEPVAMVLVPKNDLDQRYAYLLLRKEIEAVDGPAEGSVVGSRGEEGQDHACRDSEDQ